MYVYESPKATYANQPNNHLPRYTLPTKLNPCSGILHDILQAKEVIISLFWALPQIPHIHIWVWEFCPFWFSLREAESFAPLYTTTLLKLLESAPWHFPLLNPPPHNFVQLTSNFPERRDYEKSIFSNS